MEYGKLYPMVNAFLEQLRRIWLADICAGEMKSSARSCSRGSRIWFLTQGSHAWEKFIAIVMGNTWTIIKEQIKISIIDMASMQTSIFAPPTTHRKQERNRHSSYKCSVFFFLVWINVISLGLDLERTLSMTAYARVFVLTVLLHFFYYT